MCLLGCDIGSSSIKVSIVDEETGLTIGADFYPKEEAPIEGVAPGVGGAKSGGLVVVREDRYERCHEQGEGERRGYQGDRYLVPDAWLGGGGQEDGGASSIYYLVR